MTATWHTSSSPSPTHPSIHASIPMADRCLDLRQRASSFGNARRAWPKSCCVAAMHRVCDGATLSNFCDNSAFLPQFDRLTQTPLPEMKSQLHTHMQLVRLVALSVLNHKNKKNHPPMHPLRISYLRGVALRHKSPKFELVSEAGSFAQLKAGGLSPSFPGPLQLVPFPKRRLRGKVWLVTIAAPGF